MIKPLSIRNVLQAVLFTGLLFIASCTTDDNGNGTDDRDNLTGSWKCTESGTSNAVNGTPFTITIEKSGANSINIYNINNLGKSEKVTATVSGTAMSISSQTVSNFTISGTGSYQNNKLTMSYIVDSDAVSATCTRP